MKSLRQKTKELAEHCGSQIALSERIGCTNQTIWNILHRRNVKTNGAISKAIEELHDEVFSGSSPDPSKPAKVKA